MRVNWGQGETTGSGERAGSLLTEQFRLLSSQIPTMYMIIVINAAFLQFVTSDDRLNVRSYAASIILAAIAVTRVLAWRRKAGRPAHSDSEMARALNATIAMSLVVALGLAGWSIHVLLTADPMRQSYVPFFTALSSITCAACLIGLPAAAYMVIFAGVVPISLALLASGSPALISSGVNLLLISALLVGLVRRQHRQLGRMVASHAETVREKRKVIELAFSDQLTGLPNRRAFLEALARLPAEDGDPTIAVAMLDLDGFKAINDTFGHFTGDGVLKAVAERLRDLLSPGDTLARLGGDEFALLLTKVATLDEARHRLAPVVGAFHHPFTVEGKALKIGTSLGVAHALGYPDQMVDLIHRADLALYESKNTQRAMCGFEAGMDERVRRRVAIEQAASDDSALARLSLRFQPIFCRKTMRVDRFEALARWNHPTLGEIPPSEFIAVAERRGMTHRLTAVLLRQALETAATWPEGVGLSFNLSADDLASPDLCELIANLCADYGFPPSRLSVEITETALLKDLQAVRVVIDELRTTGIRVLLDDFGAGFASIGYLRQIRFDGIKLDGSLIASITDDEVARDLLLGVLQLCRAIGSPVTAEMVETHEHLCLLETMGVDSLQGYYFGMPMRAGEVAPFLAGQDCNPLRLLGRPGSLAVGL